MKEYKGSFVRIGCLILKFYWYMAQVNDVYRFIVKMY